MATKNNTHHWVKVGRGRKLIMEEQGLKRIRGEGGGLIPNKRIGQTLFQYTTNGNITKNRWGWRLKKSSIPKEGPREGY